MKGTKFSRLLFQLQPKTHRTEEIDVGLLPTVTSETGRKSDFKQGGKSIWTGLKENNMLPTPKAMEAPSASWENRKPNSKFKPGVTLTDLKVWGMLPTPTGMVGDAYADNSPNSHLRHTPNLATLASKGMLPTPATRDYKGANSIEHLRGENGTVMNHIGQLPNYLKFHTGQTSQLNPRFVAEMMGFPPNWTELPFQSGEQNPSRDMEMP
jgi:hypothetical protein